MGEKYWFPRDVGYDFKGERVVNASEGATMREVYAGLAMQAILSAGQQANQRMGEAAVHAADVLIKELGVKK